MPILGVRKYNPHMIVCSHVIKEFTVYTLACLYFILLNNHKSSDGYHKTHFLQDVKPTIAFMLCKHKHKLWCIYDTLFMLHG